ncbi:MAG: tetratricopeptide repeat protein [Bifidobacteriaceae bacterium]|jgi:tetratricopeptide (TPR) repeat protein|nr:tetratricopeptide repeat protein [Bifidobacteriaceae bacterium]MCI1915298.1 tetratricopeptide repeat protein [Bifidobacteriaceae bacterium]
MPFSSTHSSEGANGADEQERNEVLAGLAASSQTLHPMVKRRLLPPLPGQPEEITLGWVQLPASRGTGFSLGLFSDKRHFSQIALVDGHGRVFMGDSPTADTFERTPAFRFVPDQVSARSASNSEPPRGSSSKDGDAKRSQDDAAASFAAALSASLSPDSSKSLHGAIVGQDEFDHPLWLAAWRSKARRYDLLELRPQLPAQLRTNLEYRDAMAIAFFSIYLLPRMSGFLVGYGAGNIFRRLRQEAPVGAIRRSVADVLRASQQGLRVSGLEEHFSHLMHEVGALDELPGLETVHGAEPMHLFTSSYSKSFFLSWSNGLEYRSALKALQIEGNLNRFAQVSAIFERNRRRGKGLVEDEASVAQAARIDMNVLENPALIALPTDRVEFPDEQPQVDAGLEVSDYPEYARKEALNIAATAVSSGAQGVGYAVKGSEWVYRQTMATLIRRLRLPYRFDAEFRSNLAAGNVAVGFTTAGMAMMPQSRYDNSLAAWRELSRDERAEMSANYNLRVGIILAALGFGADESVRSITLQIDSIGLEEAVEEQDSAIAQMLTDALSAFEQARTGHGLGATGAKGDPKDGDVHGNPVNAAVPPSQPQESRPQRSTPSTEQSSSAEAPSSAETSLGDDVASQARESSAPESPAQQGSSSPSEGEGTDLDAAFNAVMQGVDLPEMNLDEPGSASATGDDGPDSDLQDSDDGGNSGTNSLTGDADAAGDDESQSSDVEFNPADPMSVLHKNPTVRRMLTVTFSRDEFLSLLGTLGLTRPVDFYSTFNANMHLAAEGGLQPIDANSGWSDAAFAPVGAQEEPELSDRVFTPQVAQVLGAQDSLGLSIQREDLLQRAVTYFNELSRTESLTPVESAQKAMKLVERIDDPELAQKAGIATGALIDGQPTPDISFEMSKDLNAERLRARDELFKGQTAQAVDIAQQAVQRYDAVFNSKTGIPRYFNSYAERVVYNKIFAMPGEKTVLIPDNLFYAHMELADLLAQISGPQAAITHLNKMVSYAPAYPLSHLRLSAQLARIEDWDSARAATLNALRVALDRDDAAFAYYRYAYSAWMRDEFDLAVAGYIMSDAIRPGGIPALQGELAELTARVESQCIEVPQTPAEAAELLADEGVPVWPSTEVTKIVRRAARVAVDEGLFVPARTLSLASARLDDSSEVGLDMVQAQFLRSLNA